MSDEQAAEIARLTTALHETNLEKERHRLDIIEKLETIIKLQKILGEIGKITGEIGTTTDQITEGILRIKRGKEYVE